MSSSAPQVSTTPLWGRAWELLVTLPSGDSAKLTYSGWDPEALRMTFDVLESTIASPYWFANIAIYNLTDATMLSLFNAAASGQALWVTLKAGYQVGSNFYSIIWDGPVLQVMFDQENVVDRVIRLNCIQAANKDFEQVFLNLATGPLSTQYQAVERMIQQGKGTASEQISNNAQQAMTLKQYPRGKTFFGKTSKYIAQMAQDNGLNTWVNKNQNYISELYNSNNPTQKKPDIVYGPPVPPGATQPNNAINITRSILGIPVQNPMGATMTVLLDPRLKVQVPPMVIQIDNSIIQQYKLSYGQNLPTWWDQSGQYVVAQVRHYGDTRGNDWCTETTLYMYGYAQNLLEGLAALSVAQ